MSEKEGWIYVWAPKDRWWVLELFSEKELPLSYCMPQMIAFCKERGMQVPELVKIRKGTPEDIVILPRIQQKMLVYKPEVKQSWAEYIKAVEGKKERNKMGRVIRQFQELHTKLASDIFFLCDLLHFSPTFQQRELLQAVQDGHERIAVKSGQGPGKTACSIVIGFWRALRSYRAQVIVTAPTIKQCRDVWLKEARLWVDRADPILSRFINVTKTKVELFNNSDWGIITVTASREENAQGYHDDSLTVIAEEASGISPEIITTFKGTLSNADALFLMIGNPNSRDCEFFNCFNRQRHEWKCITFNAEETGKRYAHTPFGQGIMSRNEALAKEFGRDSNVYRVRVLGEFPHTDPNTVMSSEELEHCTGNADRMYKHVLTKRANGEKIKQFGLDFARFGGDENVFFRRQGNAIVDWGYFVHTEPKHLVERVFMLQKQAGWSDEETIYVPDANGMGEGMMIEFHERGKRVIEFKAQMTPSESEKYDNIITEAWFNMRNLVRNKNCYIPNDNQLIQQLSGRQYFITNKGKIAIESKDDYKKRHENQSPDRADALVMAFYDQIESVGHAGGMGDGAKSLGVKIKRDM